MYKVYSHKTEKVMKNQIISNFEERVFKEKKTELPDKLELKLIEYFFLDICHNINKQHMSEEKFYHVGERSTEEPAKTQYESTKFSKARHPEPYRFEVNLSAEATVATSTCGDRLCDK